MQSLPVNVYCNFQYLTRPKESIIHYKKSYSWLKAVAHTLDNTGLYLEGKNWLRQNQIV